MKSSNPNHDYPGFVCAKKRCLSPVLFLIMCFILAILLSFLLLQPAYSDPHGSIDQAAVIPMIHSSPTSTETALPEQAEPPFIAPVLVNAQNPISSDYDISQFILLNTIETGLFTVKEPETYADPEAVKALERMLAQAHQDGLTIWQISEAYRSISEQQTIWDEKYTKYRNENGLSEQKALEAVLRRVASPGCSEHHTGLAFDLTVPGESFRKTTQSAWLAAHCHEYGFIIRYTEEKEHVTGIMAEPWHIRYVGLEAAQIMKAEKWCLEEYIQKYCRKFL